ncbi:MAG: AraC family transcriptional regulator [Bacteroidota bacterium]
MTDLTINDYQKRIGRVLAYIETHLGEKLELARLASVSNFSEFHFHRLVSAYLNESLGEHVTRLRMNKAAQLIIETTSPVNDIAFLVGYEMPSSFNKAFRKYFGMSPLEYKKESEKMIAVSDTINASNMEINVKPKIRTLKPKKVCYVQMTGDYNNSASEAWKVLCDYISRKKLWGWRTEFIGISHDDPTIMEASELRYDACITIRKEAEAENEINYKTLDGGLFAIFRYKGPYENFNQVYQGIYKNWLPQSGYELRDSPGFEKYLNHPDKTKPENLLTEIYVPLV